MFTYEEVFFSRRDTHILQEGVFQVEGSKVANAFLNVKDGGALESSPKLYCESLLRDGCLLSSLCLEGTTDF